VLLDQARLSRSAWLLHSLGSGASAKSQKMERTGNKIQ